MSTRCSGTPARRIPARVPASRSPTPSRNRARNQGSPESTRSCSPVSASSTTIRPTSGQRVVGRVDDPQRDDLVPVREPDERTFPVAGADEVGDHDDQAAPGQGGDGVRASRRGPWFARRGRPDVGSVRSSSRPIRSACRRPVPGGMIRVAPSGARVVEHRADPVAAATEQPGQDEGELGEHVRPCPRPGPPTDVHRGRTVEDQPGRQLAVLVELAHLRFVEPGGDVPVDVPRVVALDVRPQPGEVETAPPPRRAVAALDAPVEPAHDPPLQPVQQRVGRGGRPAVEGLMP